MPNPTTYRGARAPEALALTVQAGTSGLDMTAVTAATFEVTDGLGQRRSWATTLSGATSSQVLATHVYQEGDVPVVEDLTVLVVLAVPGGFRRAGPATLEVY